MNNSEIFDAVKKNIMEILPDLDESAISPDQSLLDLGANSVDRMDVITMTMEDLDTAVPLMSFKGAATVGDIVAVLATAKG